MYPICTYFESRNVVYAPVIYDVLLHNLAPINRFPAMAVYIRPRRFSKECLSLWNSGRARFAQFHAHVFKRHWRQVFLIFSQSDLDSDLACLIIGVQSLLVSSFCPICLART